jgi:hypothetical protein
VVRVADDDDGGVFVAAFGYAMDFFDIRAGRVNVFDAIAFQLFINIFRYPMRAYENGCILWQGVDFLRVYKFDSAFF